MTTRMKWQSMQVTWTYNCADRGTLWLYYEFFLHFVDVVDNSDEMPKLVEFTVQVPSKKKPRKSVHERLGQRKHIVESECESIHTSRLALYSQPRFKPYNISNRLNANYVNPAQIQRNKITLTALHSFATHALRNLSATDEQHGQLLADSIAGTFQALEIENGDDLQSESGSKYNMEVQEEISLLQVSISLSSWTGCAVKCYRSRDNLLNFVFWLFLRTGQKSAKHLSGFRYKLWRSWYWSVR